MKTLLGLSIALGLVYGFIVLFYALSQRSMIYYPAKLSLEQASQQAAVLGGSPWLDSAGRWLGWKVVPDSVTASSDQGETPKRAVVFHGNAGMALHRRYYVNLFSGFDASGPWAVYIHEYPGYGPRTGKPQEQALVGAAVAAVDQLLQNDPAPLLIIGESLGSGVASALAKERPDAVAALLLITPFDSMVSVARHHMPWLPTGWVLKERYDNLNALQRFDRPLAVVTAGQDAIVPARLAQPLLQQHTGPLLHHQQPSAGHNTLQFEAHQSPWAEVDEFLAAEFEVDVARKP